jgi:parallel beta-helix repeat protein
MYNCGQLDTRRTAIRFNEIDASGSYVKNSVIRKSYNKGIVLQSTHNMLVDNNIVFDTIGSSAYFERSANISVTNNLHVLIRPVEIDGSPEKVRLCTTYSLVYRNSNMEKNSRKLLVSNFSSPHMPLSPTT